MRSQPKIREDIDEDHTKIMNMILINYAFRTFRLIIFIFMTSYFIGVFIYIWSELSQKLLNHDDDFEEVKESYIINFKLDDMTVK